ncbi:MAG TPA: hypothetical protein VJ853_06660 [Thermoanaerobaculia bacterium]|nr:hypothetical protein [Thermoanaerobaculia bacterium]
MKLSIAVLQVCYHTLYGAAGREVNGRTALEAGRIASRRLNRLHRRHSGPRLVFEFLRFVDGVPAQRALKRIVVVLRDAGPAAAAFADHAIEQIVIDRDAVLDRIDAGV